MNQLLAEKIKSHIPNAQFNQNSIYFKTDKFFVVAKIAERDNQNHRFSNLISVLTSFINGVPSPDFLFDPATTTKISSTRSVVAFDLSKWAIVPNQFSEKTISNLNDYPALIYIVDKLIDASNWFASFLPTETSQKILQNDIFFLFQKEKIRAFFFQFSPKWREDEEFGKSIPIIHIPRCPFFAVSIDKLNSAIDYIIQHKKFPSTILTIFREKNRLESSIQKQFISKNDFRIEIKPYPNRAKFNQNQTQLDIWLSFAFVSTDFDQFVKLISVFNSERHAIDQILSNDDH